MHVVIDVEQMIPPVPSASFSHVKHQPPIRSVWDVDNQSCNEAQYDGVNGRQSEVAMDVEQGDVESSFIPVQLAKKKVGH